MMRALALTLLAALVACKSKDKQDTPAAGSGSGTATATASGEPPAQPPPPPPPPPEPKKPTVEQATAALVSILTPVRDEIGPATMHGCAEGTDRVAELFETAEKDARELRGYLVDEALRTELAAVVKERKDPKLAEILLKIDASTADCKGAAEEVRKGMEKLTSPESANP